jgi:hypothetical protein
MGGLTASVWLTARRFQNDSSGERRELEEEMLLSVEKTCY